MNQGFKMILAGLVLCIMTQALMLFIDHYVLVHLGEWTMEIANKFLILNWTTVDKNLIRWFPLIVGLACALANVKDIQVLIKRVFWTLLTVLSCLLLAYIVALFTWTNEQADSPLLPQYIKYQPFVHYWTVFIAFGILVPMVPLFRDRRKRAGNNNIIDS
ncbi:MAG: phage shock protein PspC (stress-responsive transcriptional regulator) [Crocinitomicaceae bacterium]|jgi:phage shock protein PspC (stress-responsive transcriptional regulator)